jgi:hypothetical protein
VLLESAPSDSEFTVFAQQRLKKRGLPLKQNYMQTNDDFLYCERSDKVVLLSKHNDILVLKKGKQTASHLKSVGNLTTVSCWRTSKRARLTYICTYRGV